MFELPCCTIGGTPIDRDVRWVASAEGVLPCCQAHGLTMEYGWALAERYGDSAADMVNQIRVFLETTIGLTCPPLPELEELPIPPCPGVAA